MLNGDIRCVWWLVAGCLLVPALCVAVPFTPGNLLVTHDNVLFEYTRGGGLVQSVAIPHPSTTRYDATDVVVDEMVAPTW